MNINEFTINITESSVVVTHRDHQCHCELVDKKDLRVQAHLLLDDLPNTVWSDGHHEEPATRIYLIFQRECKPKLIEDFDSLVSFLNSDCPIWELSFEDNLL